MNERWRLEELARLAGQALDAAPYEGQSSGRVRQVPDARTIRYYTTIGVLDRPLEMRGRTAYYGRRHLLQIVAVKRLQSRGMSLVDIQKSIAGADNSSLKRWAALPAGFWRAATAQHAESETPRSPDDLFKPAPEDRTAAGRPRFWATEPAAATVQSGETTSVAAKPAVVLPLACGVSLVIEGRQVQELDADSLNSVRPAIEGLLAALQQAGITQEDNVDGKKSRGQFKTGEQGTRVP